jgi:ABC-type amino acid transport substrate-binding protein
VGMAVKKASKDLSDALSEAMQALKSSGEISKIFAAHGVTWLP